MELEIARADPAGNITVFVLNPPDSGADRLTAAAALLSDPALGAEQVGFVTAPWRRPWRCPWRLEMMGGEFCGNAARSFGLLAARRMGLSGSHTLTIEISGAAAPLPVHVDTGDGTAEVEMPGPLAADTITGEGRTFPVLVFEGISHVIAENREPDERLFRLLLNQYEHKAAGFPRWPRGAFGVMFYDSRNRFMRPAVWVRATDTLVFESSCGSGSAALGAWAAGGGPDGEKRLTVAQPGGAITVRAAAHGGTVRRVSIGGTVTVSEPFRYTL
jgi:diaminopimelate epimerase